MHYFYSLYAWIKYSKLSGEGVPSQDPNPDSSWALSSWSHQFKLRYIVETKKYIRYDQDWKDQERDKNETKTKRVDMK